MSVIAWDGKTLAADKRASLGTLIRTTTKVFNLGTCFAAYAGNADGGEEMLAWFKRGLHETTRRTEDERMEWINATFPASQRDKDDWAGLLVIWPDGHLWKFERAPYPIKFPPQQFAIGSGRDFALAAMHCGKTAPEAVEVACHFDSGCGNGVDVLSFE